ncbi:MAG: (2Fe-2S) ferredoxin domain-containing protein [Bacteroidota bacterium]
MPKIESFESLKEFREAQKPGEQQVIVKVALATCSNAAGAPEVMDFMVNALDKRGVDAQVTKTGCMGYCYAEPTIEVTLPNRDPVVFGEVNVQKADLIIEKFIKLGEDVEGVIPVNYKTVNEPYS